MIISFILALFYQTLLSVKRHLLYAPCLKQLSANSLAHMFLKSIIIVSSLLQMPEHSLQTYTIRGWRTTSQSLLHLKQNSKRPMFANFSTKADSLQLMQQSGMRTKTSSKTMNSWIKLLTKQHSSTILMLRFESTYVKPKMTWKSLSLL